MRSTLLLTLAVTTFAIAYLLLIDGYYHRTTVVVVASLFLLVVGVVTPSQAIAMVDWNVIGMFFGMLVLADLFLESRMPAVLAAWITRHTRSMAAAVLGLAVLASALSLFLDNVAVVLIIAPIAIALAQELRVRAAPFLIGIAMASNLQGVGVLIGDPAAMILGAHAGLAFHHFIWYLSRPSIFFAVELAAAASFVVLWFLVRKHRASVPEVPTEPPHAYVPTILLIGVITALVLGSVFWNGTSPYLASITVLSFALIGWVWHLSQHHDRGTEGGFVHALLFHRQPVRWVNHQEAELVRPRPLSRLSQRFLTVRERFLGGHRVLRGLDWETCGYLIGVFILIGALVQTGALAAFSLWFQGLAGANVLAAYILLVCFAVAVSAFVDNIPFILAMLPVVDNLAATLGVHPMLFAGGLLLGTSVGGNITPIGAAANIVAYRWIERRAGEPITFWGFVRYGLPFSLVAVAVSTTFWWFVWSSCSGRWVC